MDTIWIAEMPDGGILPCAYGSRSAAIIGLCGRYDIADLKWDFVHVFADGTLSFEGYGDYDVADGKYTHKGDGDILTIRCGNDVVGAIISLPVVE